jgi:hypothetical protein
MNQPIKDELDIENRVITLYEQANSLLVVDIESYTSAGELGKTLKELARSIDAYFEPLRVSAKAAYDQVLEKKRTELAPVNEAIELIRNNMNIYVKKEEEKRQEQERKARDQAEEDARKEREKLAKQAEKAEAKGQDEKAEGLRDKAEMVYAAPVSVAPSIDKTFKTAAGNITQAKELHIQVADIKAFLKAIVEQNVNPTMVTIGAGPLKAWVKANGLEHFPGLDIKQTVGVRL